MPTSATTIEYKHNHPLDPLDVARVFDASGIKRPTADLPRIARMFAGANLIISAWHDARLVGVSRSLTDFSYCCYLSDLAVDRQWQGRGIGTALMVQTKAAAVGEFGDGVRCILLSAPAAIEFYEKVGLERHPNCFDFTNLNG